MGLLDAYHMERRLWVFPMNLENFIIIHLIHSSGSEPGGQYAVTTCPMKGYEARKPVRAEAKVLSEKCCLQCWIATNKATRVQIGQ